MQMRSAVLTAHPNPRRSLRTAARAIAVGRDPSEEMLMFPKTTRHEEQPSSRHGRRPGYTLSMRWQASADPAWEIETVHPGFTSPEEAALFAFGLTNPGAESLHLERGVLRLGLTSGELARIDDQDVLVYHLTARLEDPRQAEDADFSRVAISLRSLSDRLALDGELVFLHQRITGPEQEPVEVSVELRQGGRLEVAVGPVGQDRSRSRARPVRSIPVSAVPRRPTGRE